MCWRGYLSGLRCRLFAYGPADATAALSSLASLKSDWINLYGAGLPGCPGKMAIKQVSVFEFC